MVAAVALHEVISLFLPGQKVAIKWPNDLLFEGAQLSGILLERADDAVIIGFGVTLAHQPKGLDRPAPSDVTLAGRSPDACSFLEAPAHNFTPRLHRVPTPATTTNRCPRLPSQHPHTPTLSPPAAP